MQTPPTTQATPLAEEPALSTDPRLVQIEAALEKVQSRLRLREVVSRLPLAVALGFAASILLGITDRFRPLITWPLLLASSLGLVLAAVAVVTAYALLRPRDLFATARRADRLLSLDERLSTALEDARKPLPNASREAMSLFTAQLGDALSAARRISPAKDLPLSLDRRKWLPAGLALVAFLLASFAPLSGIGLPGRDGAVQAQVSTEQKAIEELKKAVQNQSVAQEDPARQALLKELDRLTSDLLRGDLTKEEALARLSQAENTLEKSLDQQAPAERAALEELARQLAASANSEAKKAAEALRAGDSRKAADSLKKAGENAPAMSPEERKSLADTLQAARDSTASLDPDLASRLNEAAQSLQSNDPKASKDALNNLGQSVDQKSQSLASQQQIQQALGQIQESKRNVAQAGRSTPSAGSTVQAQGTAQAGVGTPGTGGTPQAGSGTPFSGTPIASLGSPVSDTPLSTLGTAVALGSPVKGQPAKTGTPVLVSGTPGKGGTPVVAQGSQPGQGQGSGQGQGQGQGSGQGAGQSGGSGQNGVPSGGWGVGHNESVYAAPSSVNAPATQVSVQGKNNPDGEQSSTTTNTDLNTAGSAQVPYSQVYGQYKDQAGNALNSDYIPQGYKDLVRDYFTEIDPQHQP